MMDQPNQTTPDSQRNMRRRTRRTVPYDVHNTGPPPDLVYFPETDQDFPEAPGGKKWRSHRLLRKAHLSLKAPYSTDRTSHRRRMTTPESQHRLRKLTKEEEDMKRFVKQGKKDIKRLAKHFKEVDAFELEVD